ncbi:MAG TPA: hypothetical protein VIJ95_07960 [Hanamia sp.]
MKKYFILIIISCCFHPAIAHSICHSNPNFSMNKTTNENPLKKIIKKIAKANVYDASPFMSNNKVVSEQESLYKDLLNTASPEELIDLATNNKNAVVRLYAFRALMEKQKKAPTNVYDQFMNDNTPIKVINGKSSQMKPLNAISNGFLY